MVQPDLEVVQIGRSESFKAWEHGYPFHTVRWHFHPEYELHHVVDTSGRYFVGDFIGPFTPGNLVLTGPNLPHNWVSHIPEGTQIPIRSRVVQFSEEFAAAAMTVLPEMQGFRDTLDRSRCGLLFGPVTAATVGPRLKSLVGAPGLKRVAIFMAIIDDLVRATDTRTLTSQNYIPDPSGFMTTGINEALAYINDNLTEPFSETDLAEIAGLSAGAFSRAFRRHTGMSLTRYVNRLRISLACQLLMRDETMKITEACFAAGFNNLSNFNRQFLVQKGMQPTRFRALLAENDTPAIAGPVREETLQPA